MTENAIVILDNAVLNPELDSGVTDPARVGTDTIMGGSIIGGEAVAFIKEGTGTLTVGGTMDVETLALREGTIVLNGASNTLDALTLEGGGLTINGNAEVGTITGTEAGGTLAIQGTLNLTGTSSINNGAITGTGSLRIREGAELALGGEARLDGTYSHRRRHADPHRNGIRRHQRPLRKRHPVHERRQPLHLLGDNLLRNLLRHAGRQRRIEGVRRHADAGRDRKRRLHHRSVRTAPCCWNILPERFPMEQLR